MDGFYVAKIRKIQNGPKKVKEVAEKPTTIEGLKALAKSLKPKKNRSK